jgi:hypothetical protein
MMMAEEIAATGKREYSNLTEEILLIICETIYPHHVYIAGMPSMLKTAYYSALPS